MSIDRLHFGSDYLRGLRSSTYIAPAPPSWTRAETSAKTSSHWASQPVTFVFRIGPLGPERRPFPWITRIQRRPSLLDSSIKNFRAIFASLVLRPCKSISASILKLPRRRFRNVRSDTLGLRKISSSASCSMFSAEPLRLSLSNCFRAARLKCASGAGGVCSAICLSCFMGFTPRMALEKAC